MTSNLLITGCTEFISESFLTSAFPDCRIVITGNPQLKSSPDKRILVRTDKLSKSDYRETFSFYEFHRVIYFSNSVSPFGKIGSEELTEIAELLEYCLPETQVLLCLGPLHADNSAEAVLEKAFTEMSRLHLSCSANVLITPWVYSREYPSRFLRGLFKEGTHTLPCRENQPLTFLASEDLSVLLSRLFEDWEYSLDPYEIPHSNVLTAREFADCITYAKAGKKPEFTFSDIPAVPLQSSGSAVLRRKYKWFPLYSPEKDLETMVNLGKQRKHFDWNQILQFMQRNQFILRCCELLTGFAILQVLLRVSQASIQFEMIDYRLLFIVLFGTIYNMPMGIGAAALSSLSLGLSYTAEGTSWLNLFYEPTNWLPFIAYFTVGAICGYIRSRDRILLNFSREETKSIADRYTYLSKMNQDILQEKKEYKQQILGTRDSFGKIFDIAQQLNDSHPRQVISKALRVIESVMNSSSVAVYQTFGENSYGRLLISSANSGAPYSLKMENLYNYLRAAKDGQVCVNRDMESEIPDFMYAIRRDGKIEIVVMIRKLAFEQMTLYHENLFRILCGLISNSMINALDYQTAIQHEKCFPDTERILLESFFAEELRIAVSSAEQKQSAHILLQVDAAGREYPALEPEILKCIRINDQIGVCGERLLILMYQACETDFPPICRRFENAGISVSLLSASQETALLDRKAGA